MSFKETFLKPIFSRNSPSRASELDDFSMGAGERADSFSEARKSAEFESPVSSPVSAQLAADDQPGSGALLSSNKILSALMPERCTCAVMWQELLLRPALHFYYGTNLVQSHPQKPCRRLQEPGLAECL